MSTEDELKRDAALRALALVEDGMTLGLGSGSTARHFVAELGARLATGSLKRLRGVATSLGTERQASGLGIPLVDLPEDGVDLAVDGMDELSPELDAIKGLGGALLREKVVAAAARRFVLIGDSSKLVAYLGQKAPVPVEVARFGWRRSRRALEELGATAVLRQSSGEPVASDNGNFIVDCRFPERFDARLLAASLGAMPGVLEHGLFLGMAERAFVAEAGGVRELARR